jgi:transporter family protein
MSLWLVLSLVALFFWGLFGVFSNLASRYFDGYNATVWEAVGAVMTGGLVLFALLRLVDLQLEPRGVLFGVLTGISLHLGLLFMLFALNATAASVSDGLAEPATPTGKVHTILVLTAMYPLIGAVLNYLILDEPFSVRQLIGIAIGIIAIAIFMSGE